MNLFWKSYAILFFFISLGTGLYFTAADSPQRQYYIMITAFDPWYSLPFLFNILNIVLTIISSIVVLFYAFGLKWKSPVWAWLLAFRLISEILGHHYEWKFTQSAFSHGRYEGYVSIAALLFPLIPSYIAHYRFAFRQQ